MQTFKFSLMNTVFIIRELKSEYTGYVMVYNMHHQCYPKFKEKLVILEIFKSVD